MGGKQDQFQRHSNVRYILTISILSQAHFNLQFIIMALKAQVNEAFSSCLQVRLRSLRELPGLRDDYDDLPVEQDLEQCRAWEMLVYGALDNFVAILFIFRAFWSHFM